MLHVLESALLSAAVAKVQYQERCIAEKLKWSICPPAVRMTEPCGEDRKLNSSN